MGHFNKHKNFALFSSFSDLVVLSFQMQKRWRNLSEGLSRGPETVVVFVLMLSWSCRFIGELHNVGASSISASSLSLWCIVFFFYSGCWQQACTKTSAEVRTETSAEAALHFFTKLPSTYRPLTNQQLFIKEKQIWPSLLWF